MIAAIKNDETKNEEEDDEDQFEKVVTFTFLYFAIFFIKDQLICQMTV